MRCDPEAILPSGERRAISRNNHSSQRQIEWLSGHGPGWLCVAGIEIRHRRYYYQRMKTLRPPQAGLVARLGRQSARPFVGRTAEWSWLRSVLADAAAGEARVAFVRGEPGVGKSRLVLELLEAADSEGWQAVTARCFQDATGPLSPFVAELLPQISRAGLLKDAGKNRQSALLAAASAPGDPAIAAAILDPSALGSALARKVAELAARRPLFLFVDDVQWLDGGALATFRDLVLALSDIARGSRTPLMFTVTVRDGVEELPSTEVISRLLREPVARLLELGGLGEADVHELILRLTGSACDPLLLDALVSATRGNPLFVSESLGQLAARGVIADRDGTLEPLAEIERLELPPSTAGAFRDRIARVPEAFAGLLELAAVCGEECSLAVLSALVLPGNAADGVDAASKLGLVVLNGDRVRFTHALIRQAVLESMGPLKRRQLHSTIARALSSTFGNALEHVPDIAVHLKAGGEIAETVDMGALFERAGDLAMAEFSWALGARHFQQALSNLVYAAGLGQRARGILVSKLARALVNSGDSPRARGAYSKAIPLLREAHAHREWGNAILGWERTFTNAGEPIPDSRLYDEFREESDVETADVRAALQAQWAEALWTRRDPADTAAAERAVQASMLIDDVQVRAVAHTALGLAHMRHLQPQASLAAFIEASTETREDANPRVRGWGRARQAMPLVMMGRLDEARQAAERSLAESRDGNDWPHCALNLAMLTVANSLLGDIPGLSAAQAEASAMISRFRDVHPRFLRDGVVARDRLMRGELDEAADALSSWLPAAGRSIVRPNALLIQAATEGPDAARAALLARPYPGFALGVDFSSLGAACAWIEVADALDIPELAESMVEPLEAALASGVEFSVAPPLLIARVLGAASRLAGRHVQAGHHLEHALQTATRAGARPELALTHLEWARLLSSSTGSAAGSATVGDHLSSAIAAFQELGMTLPLSEARALARRHGVAHGSAGFEVETAELSTTEAEVLVALGRGLSVPQIADTLLISERTAERNLDRLRLRLGIATGADAERFVDRQAQKAAGPALAAASPSRGGSLASIALSPRESEVIGLVSLGRTNQQIADELVISLHTVARHVANIFDKTGAANRTEAARFAANEESHRPNHRPRS